MRFSLQGNKRAPRARTKHHPPHGGTTITTYASLHISPGGFAFDPSSGNSFLLNETAALILADIQAGRSLEDVRSHLVEAFDLTPRAAGRDLEDFTARLQDCDLRILGLAYDAMEPGIYMDWLMDASFLLPFPAHGGRAWIERILQIRRSHGLNLLLPNLDVELPLCIRYAGLLAEHGVKVFLPDMEQFKLRGKDRLQQTAAAMGLEHPETAPVSTHQELSAALERNGGP